MKLALGTVQFGLNYGISNTTGLVNDSEAQKILAKAFAHGINTLDTAVSYGESEERLGRVGVQHWNVITKLPYLEVPDHEFEMKVLSYVNESISRLRIGRISVLMLHAPHQLIEGGGDKLYRALKKTKSSGLVDKIGISIYDPEELEVICSKFDFDLVQAPFSIFDRRLKETGWIYRFKNMGVELHVRSVFLQGLLLMREYPEKFSKWSVIFSQYYSWLKASNISPIEGCLKYVLSFQEIDKIVIGVNSLDHLMEILMAVDGKIPKTFPEIRINDTSLLNPSNWSKLI